jgi:hypothetical protein
MANIRDLIDAVEGGNSQKIDVAFNAVMTSKVSDSLDAMRKEYSANLFKTSPADGEVDVQSLDDMVPDQDVE